MFQRIPENDHHQLWLQQDCMWVTCHHLVVQWRTALWQKSTCGVSAWVFRELCYARPRHTPNWIVLVPAANGGRGSPVFAGETDCTYYFNWDTAFACVKEKEDLLCQVSDKNKHFDLSPLTRFPGKVTRWHFCNEMEDTADHVDVIIFYPFLSTGTDVTENWEAVDAQSQKSGSRFYLNVCHKVLHTGGAADCPANASFCSIGNGYSQYWLHTVMATHIFIWFVLDHSGLPVLYFPHYTVHLNISHTRTN